MKKLCLLCLAASMFAANLYSQTTPKRIVVGTDRYATDIYAATQLQSMLKKGGLNVYIVSRHDETPTRGSIYIGESHSASNEKMHNDGYFMLGDGNFFAIGGNGEKGTLYAVYDFLERYCGYRLYSPDALVTTDLTNFSIPSDTVLSEEPAFDYREVLYYYPNNSRLYADWHRLHTREDLNRDWGMFVHTFKELIPHQRYFERHPDWFSERDGKRVRDGQLCLSNPQVLDSLCHNLMTMMEQKRDAKIWSVSNNDNYNACQCSRCLKQDSLYGGPTGTLLNFINQVAQRFPNKTISTLAYQYTRNAPKGLRVRPDKNVNIMFCSIECGRELALADNSKEASFRKDMEDWQQISDNIFMWDYIVQFRNFWDPFPNLHVIKPNLQFFRDHGVRMMFEQATGEKNITSWMELRTYITAKLLWNPDLNADSLIDDFCNGYYKDAAPYVRTIIDTMTAALIASGQRLDIYGFAIDAANSYLTPSHIGQYKKLMSNAYAAIQDSIVARRLRFFELAIDFATVELATNGYLDELYTDGNQATKIEALTATLNHLVDDLNSFGVPQMMEMGISPDEYRSVILRYIDKTYANVDKKHYQAVLRKQPSAPYTCNGAQSLCDNTGGIMDYRHAWLGFFGDTLDAVITVSDKPITINSISLDFYFYPLSWIFLPQQIDFYTSIDGEKWLLAGSHRPVNPETLATPMIKTYTTALKEPQKAKKVRVVATPLPQIPSWHRATGQPAWIFTDEIIVK